MFHEHLSEDLPPLPGAPPKQVPSPTTDVDYIIRETNQALKEGIVCLVEGSSYGQLRKMEDLRRIAAATKMHIVVGGGYYMGARYPRTLRPGVRTNLEELLRERGGIASERTANRRRRECSMSALERKAFRAIARRLGQTCDFTNNALAKVQTCRRCGSGTMDVFGVGRCQPQPLRWTQLLSSHPGGVSRGAKRGPSRCDSRSSPGAADEKKIRRYWRFSMPAMRQTPSAPI